MKSLNIFRYYSMRYTQISLFKQCVNFCYDAHASTTAYVPNGNVTPYMKMKDKAGTETTHQVKKASHLEDKE